MTRKPTDHGAYDHEGIIGYVARVQRECTHGAPKRTTGLPMGITDTCKCGATTYKLCWSPGKGMTPKAWRYQTGVRP
jgi:hypothetical protein